MGGKVAIDLEAGKNLAGSFYQPKLVLMDPAALDTLSDATFSDGMAEVIKYGCIWDRAFFDFLAAHPSRAEIMAEIEHVLYTCCDIKRQVVMADERDTGLRMILNFGHTIGHGIEAVKGIKGRRTVGLFHGECVALGMLPMIESKALQKRVRAVYRRIGLPTRTTYNKEKVLAEMLHDKKAQGGQITVIKVPGLGCWRAETIPVEGLRPLLGVEE